MNPELHLGKVSTSNFPSDAVEANPFPQSDLPHHLLILGHVLHQLLEGCQLARLPLLVLLVALRLTATLHALPPVPPGIVGVHQAASIHIHGRHHPSRLTSPSQQRGTDQGQDGEEGKGPEGWEVGSKDCQSPVSLRARQRLLDAQLPSWLQSGEGQHQHRLPSEAQSHPPHSRWFTPSFTLNFPALTAPSGTHPGTIAASLIRLQELSGWPRWCSVVSGCVQDKASNLLFPLMARESFALVCKSLLEAPRSLLLALISDLHFARLAVKLQGPGDLIIRTPGKKKLANQPSGHTGSWSRIKSLQCHFSRPLFRWAFL